MTCDYRTAMCLAVCGGCVCSRLEPLLLFALYHLSVDYLWPAFAWASVLRGSVLSRLLGLLSSHSRLIEPQRHFFCRVMGIGWINWSLWILFRCEIYEGWSSENNHFNTPSFTSQIWLNTGGEIKDNNKLYKGKKSRYLISGCLIHFYSCVYIIYD